MNGWSKWRGPPSRTASLRATTSSSERDTRAPLDRRMSPARASYGAPPDCLVALAHREMTAGTFRGPRNRLRPFDFDDEDRKSTRLNSSHVKISYAVFCL